MKKSIAIIFIIFTVTVLFTGCFKATQNTSSKTSSTEKTKLSEDKVIKVGASIKPHAEILAVAKDILAPEGYDLQIIEYNDYILPNTAVESGELIANYFQHQPI